MLVLDYHQLVAISRNGSNYDQQSGGALLSVEVPGRDGGGEPDWGMAVACVEAVGPNGDGFVAVKGMKNYASLRSRLLRLAQRLALMPDLERAAILKEHGLGTDVALKDPGRPVSSFAAQLRFGSPEIKQPSLSDDRGGLQAHWSSDEDSLSDLGSLFKELGMCMVEVGLLIARLCDAARSHGSIRESRLEQAILESGTAKGRLIHYHSLLEQEILSSLQKDPREGHRQNKGPNGGRVAKISNLASDSALHLVSTWWQQWHCDYGIFTVLTSPLFLAPTRVVPAEPNVVTEGGCCRKDAPRRSGLHLVANLKLPEQNSSKLFRQQCDSRCSKAVMEEKPQGTRSPQISPSPSCLADLSTSVQECLSPDGHSFLTVMDSRGRTTSLVIPSDYLIVQVGEAAQLLSGGELVARAHCVMRPASAKDVSRETMAVFLQPAWNRRMCLPPGVPQERALEAGGIATDLETDIPRLASRWKDGCTFAELSKETTRQYYGTNGYQSRR